MALTRINNQALTNITSAGLPSGTVLQVVTATTGTQATVTGQSTTDTGLQVSITPSSTSNKVFVTTSFNGGGDSAGSGAFFYLFRDSTVLMGQGGDYTSSGGASYSSHALTYLDSPSTTSSVTYKLRYLNQSASGVTRFNTDYSNVSGELATITVMEIAG